MVIWLIYEIRLLNVGMRRYLHWLLPKHHTALLMVWDVALKTLNFSLG